MTLHAGDIPVCCSCNRSIASAARSPYRSRSHRSGWMHSTALSGLSTLRIPLNTPAPAKVCRGYSTAALRPSQRNERRGYCTAVRGSLGHAREHGIRACDFVSSVIMTVLKFNIENHIKKSNNISLIISSVNKVISEKNLVYFSKLELTSILNLYSKQVA